MGLARINNTVWYFVPIDQVKWDSNYRSDETHRLPAPSSFLSFTGVTSAGQAMRKLLDTALKCENFSIAKGKSSFSHWFSCTIKNLSCLYSLLSQFQDTLGLCTTYSFPFLFCDFSNLIYFFLPMFYLFQGLTFSWEIKSPQ